MDKPDDFVSIAEVLGPLAKERVEANRVRWSKNSRSDDIRREVATEFVLLHLYQQAKEMADSGTITPIPWGVSEQDARRLRESNKFELSDLVWDASWGVSGEGARRLRKSINRRLTDAIWERVNRKADKREIEEAKKEARQAEIKEQESKHLAAKRVAGRYTLREAAFEIRRGIRGTGKDQRHILDRLIAAADHGELPMYRPGSDLRLRSGLNRYRDETYWNDLNSWLEGNEPHITFRFPDPTGRRSPKADIQQAYDDLRANTKKEPSKRAVAERSRRARETVHKYWPLLRRANQAKQAKKRAKK